MTWRARITEAIPFALLFGLMGGLVWFIVWGLGSTGEEQGKWRDWCTRSGGEVIEQPGLTVDPTVGANGEPGFSQRTVTKVYCYLPPGKFIQIG